MSWICKKCETENPDSIDSCEVCDTIKDGVRIYSINQAIVNQRNHPKQKGKVWFEILQTIPPPLFKSASTAEFYNSIAVRIMNNDAEAQYLLAECYFEGKSGYPQNHENAVKWYKKAALNGNQKAVLKLAQCFEHGSSYYGVYIGGIDPDKDEAIEWYKKLVDSGDIDALFKIGWLNLPINKIEAEKWFNMAAERGQIEAIHLLANPSLWK